VIVADGGWIPVVGNDACWSQIAREQAEKLHDDVGTVLARTDYHRVAEGYGGRGLCIARPQDVEPVLAEASKSPAPGPRCWSTSISARPSSARARFPSEPSHCARRQWRRCSIGGRGNQRNEADNTLSLRTSGQANPAELKCSLNPEVLSLVAHGKGDHEYHIIATRKIIALGNAR
jgi:hypothetical protein